mmetsp:Transcript_22493/g.42262  ORF Transcript_22493/g.42262 Transcript_22493/m.42262 type:complete len:102 (-) Transcript_22493:5-310(-)
MEQALTRTSLQLYRDCLRLIGHIAPGGSAKGSALRHQVRSSFALNKHLTSPSEIETAKAGAVRALANFMLVESAGTDKTGGLQKAMKNFNERVMNEPKGNE